MGHRQVGVKIDFIVFGVCVVETPLGNQAVKWVLDPLSAKEIISLRLRQKKQKKNRNVDK